MQQPLPPVLCNAWIYIGDDAPPGSNYNSPNSTYQNLIKWNGYQWADQLNIAFFTTVPTGPNTIPSGNGSSWTIDVIPSTHPGGLTGQDYFQNVMRDARAQNSALPIMVTSGWHENDIFTRVLGS